MRTVIPSIVLVFVVAISSFAQPTPFEKDTLVVRMILDSCGDTSLTKYSVWRFITGAPWLRNVPTDTAGGRIRSLTFGGMKTLHPAIGNLDSLKNLYIGGQWDPTTGGFLASPLPLELFTLPVLRLLTLLGRQLDSLPAAIGMLGKLEQLVARNNAISHLPDEFGNLRSLKYCDLSENKIRKLPATIGNLSNLEHLDLCFNAIDSLPREIGNLNNLIYAVWDHNRITNLPMEVGRLTKLSRLYLNSNKLHALPDSFIHITAAVSVDSNYLCSLPCNIQSHLDLVDYFTFYGWRNTQICTVLPVPPCSTISIIRPASPHFLDNRLHGSAAIYDLRGRYLGTSSNSALPAGLRTGIYISKSTAAHGKAVKQCVFK